MGFENKTRFSIKCLNQEKLLSQLCKDVSLSDVDRRDKSHTVFSCSTFDEKKVLENLKKHNVEIIEKKTFGFLGWLRRLLTSYGLLCGIFLSLTLYFLQCNIIWNYQINGADGQVQNEICQFIKKNYSRNKLKIDTKNVETNVLKNFKQISFVSCIVKGQTLVLNVKEKVLPDEMYGQFKKIVATKNSRIKEINHISGTLCVKAGDFVKAGQVLVEPYVVDTSGQIKKVEAKAEIVAEVYNEGQAQHSERFVEVVRTGRTCKQNQITLFGLEIYSYSEPNDFKMFDEETKQKSLIKNLLLPFKITEKTYFELEKRVVESNFDDVKDEYIEKAHQKALENCQNCDKIIEEYYSIKSFSNLTIVKYCVVTEEKIGGYCDD